MAYITFNGKFLFFFWFLNLKKNLDDITNFWFEFDLQSFFPAMTKIVGTLGPKSRTVEIISGCLKAGMSGITFL